MHQLLRGHEIEVNIQLLCTHRAVSRNLFQPRQIPSRPLASPFPALLPPPFPSLPSLTFPGPLPPGGPTPVIQLGGLGESCELPQRVRAEPGRQTVSVTF